MAPVSRVSLLLVIALVCLDCCYTATIPRSFDPRIGEEMVLTPKKRPFCNAFTGCGRKRSQTPGMPQEIIRQRQFVDDEALGSLLDSENAIDELSRQILSEAKLWEAIQEASAEIARRKQKDYQ
ncbi:cardioactive peptide [Galleria mellonella]|uniref:Cardioactive peptide n=1 Tax=Galleria mellonella TaxID=7137 RepID=A0A6J3C1L3_GALME|nr:cardioactive peptide [Galleria mellonella]XP_031766542.1 cardioactive peptide [Galleria mellonella]